MKKLLFILPLLVACKSKATCDAYSIYQVPYNDSIIISQWHEHVEFDKKNIVYLFQKKLSTIQTQLNLEYQLHINTIK